MKKIRLFLIAITLIVAILVFSTFYFKSEKISNQDAVLEALNTLDWPTDIVMTANPKIDVFKEDSVDSIDPRVNAQLDFHSYTQETIPATATSEEQVTYNYLIDNDDIRDVYYYSTSDTINETSLVTTVMTFDDYDTAKNYYQILITTNFDYTVENIILKDNMLICAYFTYTVNGEEKNGVTYLKPVIDRLLDK